MNLEEARKLLDIDSFTEEKEMKRKFRLRMHKAHPDVVRSELEEHRHRAQELNEAYEILKQFYRNNGPVQPMWKAPVNEAAFRPRNIYMPYSADIDVGDLRQRVASGKYMWDPEEEFFSDFMKSCMEVCTDLLLETEDSAGADAFDMERLNALRFYYQTHLLYPVAMEYISPTECLRKLDEPERMDSEGKNVYCFRTFLVSKLDKAVLEELKNGEVIFPAVLKDFHIFVKNKDGDMLGYLSFEFDWMYFCLIPLMKEGRAPVRMNVKSVRRKRGGTETEITLRIKTDPSVVFPDNRKKEIRYFLDKYKAELS